MLLAWLRTHITRRVLLCAAAVLLVVLLVVFLKPERQILSSPEVSSVISSGVLRIGVSENLPHLFSEEEDGSCTGLEAELGARFQARIAEDSDTEISLEFVPMSRLAVNAHLSSDDIDAAFCQQVKGASSAFAYSSSYYTDSLVFLCKKGNESLTHAEVKVGAVQQTVAATRYKSSITSDKRDDNLTTFASYPDLMQALSSGRIDLALIQDIYAENYLTDELSVQSEPFDTVDYALVCSSENESVATYFSLVLDELRENGTLSSLIAAAGLSS